MNEETEKKKKNLIYLNTAATGLLSEDSTKAAAAFQEAMRFDPSGAFMEWRKETFPDFREKTARLIGARVDQIAFVPNFSFGLLPVIDSLKPHLHKVLLYKEDYPSVNLPFELGGFEINYIESSDGFRICMDELKEIIDREKIEIVALSHVQFLTGFKLDIDELGKYSKQKGVILIVDGTQTMGAVNYSFDEMPVDVLISSSYKWLNGGFGSAVLCIKEDFIRQFPPGTAGFGSMDLSPEGWSYTPSVSSFEPGHLNVPGLLQLEKAIDEKLRRGIDVIEKHNTSLLQKLQEGLLSLSFKIRGGKSAHERAAILCFEAGKDLYDYLTEKGFSFTWRKGLIRVSPHFYNTEEEVEELLKVLSQRKS